MDGPAAPARPPLAPPPAPPPPAPRRWRGLALLGAGIVVGVVVTVAVVAAVSRKDEGGDAIPDTSATSAPGGPPAAGSDTVAPPRFTRLDQLLRPGDVAALRAVLDELAFPSWWWLPPAVSPDLQTLPTVRRLYVRDELLGGGNGAGVATELGTTWWLPGASAAEAEPQVLAAVPADAYDIPAGTASRRTSQDAGGSAIAYRFPALGGGAADALRVEVTERPARGDPRPAPAGTEVTLVAVSQSARPPAGPPVGAGSARAFLAGAPTSPALSWSSTELTATADPAAGAASGAYRATFTAPEASADDVTGFLADPASYRGALQPVQVGTFVSDAEWEQPMAVGTFLGRYTLLKPATGATPRLFVDLEFPLR